MTVLFYCYTRVNCTNYAAFEQVRTELLLHIDALSTIYDMCWIYLGKPDSVACKQQSRKQICPSTQSSQLLCNSLSGKYDSLTGNLVRLCSWAG